jgi:ketosteroid isomerase-like protein
MNNHIIDHLLIRERMDAYIMNIDSHDNKAFAANFTEDGVYESPFGTAKGQAAIEATIAQWHAGGITTGKRHMTGPLVIHSITDGTAITSASYWIIDAANKPGIVASGEYSDVLRKVNGAWLLVHRKQMIDPSFTFNT